MNPARRNALVAAAALPLAACSRQAVQGFATVDAARHALRGLLLQPLKPDGAWSLAQVLEHAAQSVDYAITGYPEMKSALFRHTAGALAWTVFDARGAMSHPLDQPIPGAPALPAGVPLAAAVARLLAALDRFEAHTGPLQPHFAYGALDKAAYTRAHLMHLANHWQAFHPVTAQA
jgi:hypothetical protein